MLYIQKPKNIVPRTTIAITILWYRNSEIPAQHPKKLAITINRYVTKPMAAKVKAELMNNFRLSFMIIFLTD